MPRGTASGKYAGQKGNESDTFNVKGADVNLNRRDIAA